MATSFELKFGGFTARSCAVATVCAAFGILLQVAGAARCDSTAQPAPATPAPASSNAAPADSGVVSIGSRTRIIITGFIPVERSRASKTTISSSPIQHADPSLSIPQIITRFVPGASMNPDNGLRIRGADDQFSTYLDGAPIPPSISGSITDVFDPKDIRTLDVYSGGFPAEFGGQLSGLFDITTKSGSLSPSEDVSQSVAGEGSYVSTASASGTAGNVGYLASGSTRQTDFFLNPPTSSVSHDFGIEDHGFVKLNIAQSSHAAWIIDLGANGSQFEIPSTLDTQHETGALANIIWQHSEAQSSTRAVLYTHHSGLTYNSGESVDQQTASGTIIADQNQNATYTGVRLDQTWLVGADHSVMSGLDISRATADQDFTLHPPPTSDGSGGTLVDNSAPHSWNIGVYAQDDWTVKRTVIDYGARYDEYSEDVTRSQISPRVNIKYKLNSVDTAHVYYDRLFQPIAVEDALHLVGESSIGDNGTLSPLVPESDNLYEIGVDRVLRRFSCGVAAYYKTGRNVRDDDQIGDTNILLPVNDSKDYIRGVEFTTAGDLSQFAHAFGNLALCWNKNAGPVTGGLNEGDLPTTYFYDDHDQTYTATLGMSYGRRRVFADIDGEYGSGQPYGEIDNGSGVPIALNYLRVPPHFVVNGDVGKLTQSQFTASVFVNNALDDRYVIKQTTSLSNAQFAEGRIVGIRLSREF